FGFLMVVAEAFDFLVVCVVGFAVVVVAPGTAVVDDTSPPATVVDVSPATVVVVSSAAVVAVVFLPPPPPHAAATRARETVATPRRQPHRPVWRACKEFPLCCVIRLAPVFRVQARRVTKGTDV